MHTHTYLHRIHSIIALEALACLGGGATAWAQVGLGIAPMRQELSIAAGAQRSGVVNISNDSSGPVRMRAQLMDFFIDSEGIPQFRRAWQDEAPFSCRTWLTLNPMEVELNPGEQVRIRYTLSVPGDAANSSYHCAAGFSTLPPANESSGTGLQMAVRVVAAFYAIVGGPPVDGRVKDVRLEKTLDGDQPGWQGVVVLENYGTMHFRAVGELSMLDSGGNVIESVPFAGIPILPKRDQRLTFPLRIPLTEGKYTLRVRVDIGTNEIQEAVVPVVVEPPRP